MNRRTLGTLILLAWVTTIALLVRREYGGASGEPTAERWPVPPGAAFLARRLGDRQVGLTTVTVDTLGDSLRVTRLVTVDLPTSDTIPRRTSTRSVAIYSRALRLLRWQTAVLTEHGRLITSGAVTGDTLLTDIVTPEGGTPDTLTVLLRRPVVLPGAIPLVLASRGLPSPGDRLNLEVYDPLDHEVRVERLQVAAESVFTTPDSAEFSDNLRRWTVAHSDTVRAWRLDGLEDGLPVSRWVDAAGLPVRVVHALGTVEERSAFELVQTNFRALPPPQWDTGPDAPALGRAPVRIPERARLAAVVSLAHGRMPDSLPPGLVGAGQAWSGDTVRTPDEVTDDSLATVLPLAEPLLADDGSLAREASRIIGAENRPELVVRRLTDWVRRSITLEEGPGQRPAVSTLRRGRGTAAERVLLLAALARVSGLESRRVWGLAWTGSQWRLVPWVEVWTGRWWPADPARATVPAAGDRIRLALGGRARQLDLISDAGLLRLQVLEDDR